MFITFAGVGSAFCDNRYYQSNMVITANSGKRLLIDCGGDMRHALYELGVTNVNIVEWADAVYVSHLHADHIGGLEWLGFCTYFNPAPRRPKMFIVNHLVRPLWTSLKGGMRSVQGRELNLESFFDVRSISINGSFFWEEIEFTPIQMVHVMDGMRIVPSFGLLIREPGGPLIFLTTDTQFCPRQIEHFYGVADVIFQDAETAPFKSGVHAHYSDLVTLPPDTKRKMWLYHYQPDPIQDVISDGFLGFVKKGQNFEFSSR